MTKEKLTRQGVRDLSTPKNGRVINAQDACFHKWEHDRDCSVCSPAYMSRGYVSCIESCVKCGKVR